MATYPDFVHYSMCAYGDQRWTSKEMDIVLTMAFMVDGLCLPSWDIVLHEISNGSLDDYPF